MSLSLKCQYAVRALFELARRKSNGTITIGEIARAQGIPARFLEAILTELKHGGFVESRRGVNGGYRLARSAATISLGQIIRFVEGPLAPVDCLAEKRTAPCDLRERCVIQYVWARARDALANVYDTTTLQDLVEREEQIGARDMLSYSI